MKKQDYNGRNGNGYQPLYSSTPFKTDREKSLETILKQLLTHHFFSEDLEWSWKEGNSLADLDRELYMQIYKELPEVLAFHKR